MLVAGLGGAAVCAPSGPVAALCGVAAGVIAWFAIDKVAIEIDEAVSRDAMRADLLAALEEEKAALKVTLLEQQTGLIALLSGTIQTSIDGVFIPMRDGL